MNYKTASTSFIELREVENGLGGGTFLTRKYLRVTLARLPEVNPDLCYWRRTAASSHPSFFSFHLFLPRGFDHSTVSSFVPCSRFGING